ncbi:hypothetical protein [Priestia koreensis]|uniref:hypothetical protein n=1 Tax=Priestia koreensis TaxID=284581 RepID=UPI0020406A80|nr:hypothetical protein [Priestia koreensis]MCM3006126.1 hypothetical protein [Priestia koreensis]
MKENIIHVHYDIGESIMVIPTKMVYKQLEAEIHSVQFQLHTNHQFIQSEACDSIEYAVKHLQKNLPVNMKVVCCQSCRHGNFNPFGDVENEIFCLKDQTLVDKKDVVDIFSNQDPSFGKRSRKLLDFCEDYKPIDEHKTYTYNDWGLEE